MTSLNSKDMKKLFKRFKYWESLDFSIDVDQEDFNFFYPLILENNEELKIHARIRKTDDIINLIKEFVKVKNLKKIVIVI